MTKCNGHGDCDSCHNAHCEQLVECDNCGEKLDYCIELPEGTFCRGCIEDLYGHYV
ncbi:MAG: hypothetical protein IJ168_07975 [Eubacterium sp.]|nr:hypothetical protein [Eubacterium sp.]